MSGPNFTGAAIFSGVGQGIDKAVDNVLKLKQMQMMDDYHKHRLVVQGVNDFYARGGHRAALNDGQEDDAGSSALPEMDFDPAAVEAANPTRGALALGE